MCGDERLVDVDVVTLDRAKLILGTYRVKDTVNAALCEAVRAVERRDQVDRAARKRFAVATRDPADDGFMTEAWR